MPNSNKKTEQKPVVHYREVKLGHYVSEDYAKKHPNTTVKETDKPTPKKKP